MPDNTPKGYEAVYMACYGPEDSTTTPRSDDSAGVVDARWKRGRHTHVPVSVSEALCPPRCAVRSSTQASISSSSASCSVLNPSARSTVSSSSSWSALVLVSAPGARRSCHNERSRSAVPVAADAHGPVISSGPDLRVKWYGYALRKVTMKPALEDYHGRDDGCG